MEENGDGKSKAPAIVEFDGMRLPPSPTLREDAKKRFEEIRNLECRKDDVILAIYPKSGKPMGGWFAYEKEFEQAETNDTRDAIFTVHYESLKKNPIEETKRLAKFLDVDVNDEIIAEISDKCSFRKLKEANATVKDHSQIIQRSPKYEEIMLKMYRKGEISDWKNHFTVTMNEEFDTKFKEEMKDSKIQVQYE